MNHRFGVARKTQMQDHLPAPGWGLKEGHVHCCADIALQAGVLNVLYHSNHSASLISTANDLLAYWIFVAECVSRKRVIDDRDIGRSRRHIQIAKIPPLEDRRS